ncbi:MAG TPA: YMGG-like glycine zipper-containing protein [Rariglobus sp.]
MKKTLLALCVASLAAGSAHAQLFRPSVIDGAILGGVAGAIIGNNSGGRHGGEGAAIGAVAGALVGAAIDQPAARPVVVTAPPPVYCPPPAPAVVYVEPAPVYCPPPPPHSVVVYYPRTVTVYSGYECPPPRRVVYVNGWGRPAWACAPQYGHGRWR